MRFRMKVVLAGFMAGVMVLVCSLSYVQLYNHEYYLQKAVNQQTQNTVIPPQRGTIYDRNMQKMAESVTVEDIGVDPKYLDQLIRNGTIKLSVEEIARFLADTLQMDYNETLEIITAKDDKGVFYQDRTLQKKVDKDVADVIREYRNENSIWALKLTESTKRYYPDGNFAAHVLGYVDSDNVGRTGIEGMYEEQLRGVAGSVVAARKGSTELPYGYEKYVEPQDGSNVVLTIDKVIQHYLEKYLEEAKIEYKLEGKATGIVMNVNTGEVLAMACKEDFDPNDPRAITDQEVLDEAAALPEDQQQQYLSDYLQYRWRNFAVSDTYEPGSVFKIFTASAALEEGAANLNSTYFCGGQKSVVFSDGTRSGCWSAAGHGQETFADALRNSCNPALMQMAKALGREAFYKYQQAFGFGEKTGIDIIGEANSQLYSVGQLNEVELAICSFGQTFKVTPIQMITAISAIANGGTLYQPYLVKELRDNNGIVTQTMNPVAKRQVISEETANTMAEIMETVVGSPTGTGKNAYIKGFRIAGKTGTSEKRDTADTEDRIASFGGFAPADDPQVACIIILDDPGVLPNGGGAIAAPIFRKVMEDTLNYLGVEKQYTASEMNEIDVVTPDVTGKSVAEAQTTLTNEHFNVEVVGEGDTVLSQLPKGNVSMPYGSKVYLYTDENTKPATVTVPDLTGYTAKQANQALTNLGLNVRTNGPTDGTATVTGQSVPAGTEVTVGTLVVVELVSVTNVGD